MCFQSIWGSSSFVYLYGQACPSFHFIRFFNLNIKTYHVYQETLRSCTYSFGYHITGQSTEKLLSYCLCMDYIRRVLKYETKLRDLKVSMWDYRLAAFSCLVVNMTLRSNFWSGIPNVLIHPWNITKTDFNELYEINACLCRGVGYMLYDGIIII